jgi:hypothetical protein
LASGVLMACGGNVEHDATGMGGGGPGGGGTGGSGATTAPNCSELSKLYGVALNDAKRCHLLIDVAECNATYKSSLTCGCSTHINPDNVDAVAELNRIEKAWTDQGCSLPTPCPSSCPVSPNGACESDGTSTETGSCADRF